MLVRFACCSAGLATNGAVHGKAGVYVSSDEDPVERGHSLTNTTDVVEFAPPILRT